MKNDEFETSVRKALAKGELADEDLPYLRGYAKYAAGSKTPENTAVAMTVLGRLSEVEDHRDLLLDLGRIVAAVGYGAVVIALVEVEDGLPSDWMSLVEAFLKGE